MLNDDISASIPFKLLFYGNKKHTILSHDKPAKAESLVVKIQRLKERKNRSFFFESDMGKKTGIS
jgi:hypothetical protein